jgi:hypothetical protein
MNNLKIGDFVGISYSGDLISDNYAYILKITNLNCDSTNFLEGIIIKCTTYNNLFKKRKLFLKNNSKHIKKIIDINKIKELELIYKIHLIKQS